MLPKFLYFRLIIIIGVSRVVVDGSRSQTKDFQLSGRAMAANDRLIVSIQNRTNASFSAVQNYHSSSKFCSLEYNSTNITDMDVMMIAVAQNANILNNTNRFVFAGYSKKNSTVYLVSALIDFQTCEWNTSLAANIPNITYPKYSILAMNPNGDHAFYFWDRAISILRFNSTGHARDAQNPNFTSDPYFFPSTVDLRSNWGILAGYRGGAGAPPGDTILQPVIYQFNYTSCPSRTCATVVGQLSFPRNIRSFADPPTAKDFLQEEYKPLYDISVSIHDSLGVLVGIQFLNTVFRFVLDQNRRVTTVEIRTRSSGTSVGFGKAVGWLDNTTAIILSNTWNNRYTRCSSSLIELYALNVSTLLSNRQGPYAVFPNIRSKLWSTLQIPIVDMIAENRNSSLMVMDKNGKVYVIRPSPAGFYPETTNAIGMENTTVYIDVMKNTTIYFAPMRLCQSGLYKDVESRGKDLFRLCDFCRAGTYYLADPSSRAIRCHPCTSQQDFCPFAAANRFDISTLESVSQMQTYPQNPESDVLEDIMISHIFSVNFSLHCLPKQPLFWAFIILGLGCTILIIMGILKVTKRFPEQRQMLRNVLKQTDLIGEGELWVGGIASFIILVICIFAYYFSASFMNQYPIESAGPSTFACDSELFNAKFSTTMQSLATPLSKNDQPLFDLLEKQTFTLNVDFISTGFSPEDLSVGQMVGSSARPLNSIQSYDHGILRTSTRLTAHSLTVIFNFSGNLPIGAIRVGISAPEQEEDNYLVKALDFSEVISNGNWTMTQDPKVNIQLIRLVNETQALSSGDDNQYSAIWVPTYSYDKDQMFYSEEAFRSSHIKPFTSVFVTLSESSYFIYNTQEPITRLTDLIFTNILFTTMCIELFALTFLFYKLAISPIIKLLAKLFGLAKVTPTQTVGCPYCQPFDVNALPAYQVPVQRAESSQPPCPIQRRSPSDIDHIEILE